MLTHYIFVRRDLPLGTIAAMVCHAAGESATVWESDNGYEYVDRPAFKGATAVILEAKDEAHLTRIQTYLASKEISFIPIVESSPPYMGQLMALGLVPVMRSEVSEALREFQTLKTSTYTEKSVND